jgi:hypothetical protein
VKDSSGNTVFAMMGVEPDVIYAVKRAERVAAAAEKEKVLARAKEAISERQTLPAEPGTFTTGVVSPEMHKKLEASHPPRNGSAQHALSGESPNSPSMPRTLPAKLPTASPDLPTR